MAGVMKTSHTTLEDLYATDGTGIEFFRCGVAIKRLKFLLRSLRFDNILTRKDSWLLINWLLSWICSMILYLSVRKTILLVNSSLLTKCWRHFGQDAASDNVSSQSQPDMESKSILQSVPRPFIL